jgi:hypothetical protein
MEIKTLQFVRPNGRRVERILTIPDEYEAQYKLLQYWDCYLSCEQLMNGTAVHYISHKLGDFDTKMSKPYDEKDAMKVLLKQIEAFNEEKFLTWRTNMENQENGPTS